MSLEKLQDNINIQVLIKFLCASNEQMEILKYNV